VPVHSHGFDKLASTIHIPDRITKFVDACRPRTDGVYIYLTSLGADEWWGQNRNADAFNEWSLKGDAPPEWVEAIRTAKGFRRPTAYGMPTYLSYGGIYYHHENNDPTKSVGDVAVAVYSPYMHRGELVIFVSKALAPDIVNDANNNIPIPWSQGCKVSFDVCRICRNAAKTRKGYCNHMLHAAGRILDNGMRVGVYNPFPVFFDISRVHIPADRSAWDLMKIAGAARMPSKRQVPVLKLADIEKRIDEGQQALLGQNPINPALWRMLKSIMLADNEDAPDLPTPIIRAARGMDACDSLSALTAGGIVLKPTELNQVCGDKDVPESLNLDRGADLLRGLLGPLADRVMADRSAFDPHVSRRISILVMKHGGPSGKEKLKALKERSGEKSASAPSKYKKYAQLLFGCSVDGLRRSGQDSRIVLAGDYGASKLAFTEGSELSIWPMVASAAVQSGR
jgi:hypothetical protein